MADPALVVTCGDVHHALLWGYPLTLTLHHSGDDALDVTSALRMSPSGSLEVDPDAVLDLVAAHESKPRPIFPSPMSR